LACDKCGIEDIAGIRYKCANCEDFNLCAKCYDKKEHTKHHVFLKFDFAVADYDQTTPIVLIKFLDERLYPRASNTSKKNAATNQGGTNAGSRLQRGVSREQITSEEALPLIN
jgi:hypothetical protein